jgi:hypothetical protein
MYTLQCSPAGGHLPRIRYLTPKSPSHHLFKHARFGQPRTTPGPGRDGICRLESSRITILDRLILADAVLHRAAGVVFWLGDQARVVPPEVGHFARMKDPMLSDPPHCPRLQPWADGDRQAKTASVRACTPTEA